MMGFEPVSPSMLGMLRFLPSARVRSKCGVVADHVVIFAVPLTEQEALALLPLNGDLPALIEAVILSCSRFLARSTPEASTARASSFGKTGLCDRHLRERPQREHLFFSVELIPEAPQLAPVCFDQ
jgi:hypothetical protein